MDITPQDTTQQPISDDQELAKALAGVLPDEPEPAVSAAALGAEAAQEVPALQFEETPAPTTSAATTSDNTQTAQPAEPAVTIPDVPEVPEAPSVAATPATTGESSDLADIKKDALDELRPLMDKVTLPAEEKFNTYLMLIRSTDDASLIGPAHAAAQAISDESVKAQALLDIIKEIDYLSRDSQTTA
tara:strand:- start:2776 stop:3339 length:564 start_codon:yes stop_codon:yes gene_type:complete